MKKSLLKPIILPASIQQYLHTYAVAAGAAGVSVLALAQPSETEIIYTPANAPIGPGVRIYLDLNKDGTTDFWFNATWIGSESFASGYMAVHNAQAGNAVMATLQRGWVAEALQAGAAIGPAANFSSGTRASMAWGWFMGSTRPQLWKCYGPWEDTHRRYLGLRFMINGEVHYGWARLNERCQKGYWHVGKLTAYAYETIPDQGLVAGQKKEGKIDLEDENLTGPGEATLASTAPTPATLGMLAKGAASLGNWRERVARNGSCR